VLKICIRVDKIHAKITFFSYSVNLLGNVQCETKFKDAGNQILQGQKSLRYFTNLSIFIFLLYSELIIVNSLPTVTLTAKMTPFAGY
jgi:hypothetical protein